ncbi:MAG TPA: nitroreductase family protein [Candidatus Fimousia stercorigallinarum]|nr:nitroreductase family protein [Candidatus Fimousia stercorigallinarum]
MLFEKLAHERYSVRAFQSKPVEKEKIQKIIAIANSAPTATNAQPVHIWAIVSEEGVRRVNETTKCDFGAPAVLVLGTNAEEAWTREEDAHNFADIDAGIVGTHLLFAICEQGLGTTWVGRVDPEKLIERFPEMKGYEIAGIFPIGYPADGKAGQPSAKHTKRKAVEEIMDFI